jgi:glucose/arabinose dehydrogenase
MQAAEAVRLLAGERISRIVTSPYTSSSVLDLVFYAGDQFPAEFKGSLFVALKGSWNRSVTDEIQSGARAVQGWPAGGLL